MKQLLACVLLALSSSALAQTDPSERYLDAYFLIQDGDNAEAASDWVTANAKYAAALEALNNIKADAPDWHANLLQFRIRYCSDHLAAIKPKLPVAPPPAPPPPPVESAAPPSEEDQVRQLQAELQKARDEVQKLTETRDRLSAQLEAKLKERAPTDRQSAQETLEQLRALQAVNDAVTAKLESAREKAARADQLEAQLQQSQERIRGLETERTGLNAKLQDALGKLSAAQSSPQVEALLKKNADLTAQLAAARAEITGMRDELAGAGKATAAEAVSLRAQISQLNSELEQTKVLLAERTEELKTTRTELEQVRAENVRLSRSRDEILARLDESERQLSAARASTGKDNEIIQQLRKENALLREIAGKQEAQAKAAPPAKPKGGFLWFKPKQPAPATNQAGPAESSVARSETGKLTAAVKAPAHPESEAAPPVEPPATSGSESPLVRSLLADARAALARQDLDAAAAKYQSVLEQDPNNGTALTNLGVIYYQQGKLEQAEQTLQKAATARPNDSQSRSVLGVVYFRKGRIEDAYNELARAVALNPRNAEAHNYLGIIMSEKGWATAAEQEVRRAIELNPQYSDAHFNLAVIYSRQKTPRLELARYHYQRARELGSQRDPQLETALGLESAGTPK